MRFLSPDKQKQETVRIVGLIIFFIASMLLMSGYATNDLLFIGTMLLVWYSMSWFIYRKNPEKIIRGSQQLWHFLIFLVFAFICGIATSYFSDFILHDIFGNIIYWIVILFFLVLLFYRK